jgi:hypothetical protein
MEQNIYLNDFIEKFNEQPMLRDTIFTELYDEYIIPVSKRLQNEVNENMLTLPSMDRENYLNYVKNRIIDETIGNLGSSIINKWTKKFNLEKNEFPFIDNEKVKILLSTWGNQPGLSYEEQKLVKYMQKDFYLHTFYLESCKIIKIIDDYLLPMSISPKGIKKNELKYFKIKAGHSKKQKALSLFNALVTHKCIDANSKEDFINAFTGIPPSGKINWIGSIGDLNILINYSIEAEFIEEVRNQWVYAENIFLLNGSIFTRKKIKDAHITKNKTEIIKIVKSII